MIALRIELNLTIKIKIFSYENEFFLYKIFMTDKQFINKYNEDGMVLINNIISSHLVKQFKNEIKIATQNY